MAPLYLGKKQMSQNLLTQYEDQIEEIIEELLDQVSKKTPYVILEAIAAQIYSAREARKRVLEEGSVVRDIRGEVVPHPALKIEANATKLYVEMVTQNQPKVKKL